MELYQTVLEHLEKLLEKHPERKEYAYDPSKKWPETEKFELVMGRDTAYELGGSNLGAANYTCVTTDPEAFTGSKTVVIGKDLKETGMDVPYARLVILSVDPEMLGDLENKKASERAFRTLQKLDFIKYHVFAKGYMVRTSSENFKEQVRVSKKALAEGISFEKVGNCFLDRYLKVDGVKAAKVIFITDPSEDYKALQEDAKKVHEITMTLSRILEGMPTDCSMCSLKPVCDEVEGMREVHFGKERTKA